MLKRSNGRDLTKFIFRVLVLFGLAVIHECDTIFVYQKVTSLSDTKGRIISPLKNECMGRYYSGDIEGKFWYGIQPSDDPTFFGAIEDPHFVAYYADDLKKANKGIRKCLRRLGKKKASLDDYFSRRNCYSDEDLASHMGVSVFRLRYLLLWYARLELGKKIKTCIEEQGDCCFQAEC